MFLLLHAINKHELVSDEFGVGKFGIHNLLVLEQNQIVLYVKVTWPKMPLNWMMGIYKVIENVYQWTL